MVKTRDDSSLVVNPSTSVGGLGAIVLPHEDDREAVVESAERTAALGIDVELAQERGAALIVFGPLLLKIGRIRMRRAARRIRREAGCLVWIAPDG